MCKVSKLIILFLFLSFIFLQFPLFSQLEEQPSPLGPGKGRKQTEIGLSLGFGPTWQNGELYASCDCPSFKDGSGFVFTPGILYEKDITSFFHYGLFLGLTFQNANASYKERELLNFKSQTGEVFVNVPVLFREKVDINFNQIYFLPFLSLVGFDLLDFKIGIRIGIPFSTSIKHTKELLEEKVRLNNGETIDVSIGNSNQVVLEDGKLEKANSVLFSFIPSIGLRFRLTGNLFSGINFSYVFPLNNYSERGNNFRLNYWLLSVDFRYALVLRKWFED